MTTMREDVAKAMAEFDPYKAVFDFDSPHRDVPIGVLRDQQVDAAITTVLTALAADWDTEGYDEHLDDDQWQFVMDWVRSFLPSQPEVKE